MLPNSDRITSDVRALVSSFDPAKPVVYELLFDTLPRVQWAGAYKDIEVTVQESGEGGGSGSVGVSGGVCECVWGWGVSLRPPYISDICSVCGFVCVGVCECV